MQLGATASLAVSTCNSTGKIATLKLLEFSTADARLKPIRLGNQVILFKTAAPSRLFWAGPAMRIVQALYWMQDILADSNQRQKVMQQLRKVLLDPNAGPAARDDLQKGFSALPIWMQQFVTDLIRNPQTDRETEVGIA